MTQDSRSIASLVTPKAVPLTLHRSRSAPPAHDVVPPPARDVVGPLCRASSQAGLPSVAQRLSEVRSWMDDDLHALEALLAQSSEDSCEADAARRAAAHLLQRPGKRIRPLCTLLAARLMELPIDSGVRELALAGELVHAATLLHDDVIDEGDRRRGAPTARVVFSNSASILGGDYLLVEALQRVVTACHGRSQAPLGNMLDTIAQMVAGEAIQLEMRHGFAPSRERYLQVVDGKTASLFRWALRAPALLDDRAGFDEPLGEVGNALGLAFQLIDDALDFAGDSSATGKDLLADLLQGKATWPVIIACERIPALADDIRQLLHDAAGGSLDASAAEHIVTRIIHSGGIEQTHAFAEDQRRRAQDALDHLPNTRARAALCAVIDAAARRAA